MRRLIPLLFLIVLLTGCGLGKDYLSLSPHIEEPPYVTASTEEDPSPVVSNRLELRGAILSLIDNWKEQDTIIIRDYEGDVAQNLSEIMEYATTRHPTGAYAVDYADAEILEENGQQTVQVSFVFRRSMSEINAIVLVDNSENAYTKIVEALGNYSTSLTLRIRRYSDRDFAGDIVEYCMTHPRVIPVIPEFSVKLYPEEGEHRILELHLSYPESKDVMREKLSELETTFQSAITYGKAGKNSTERAQRLCHYLIRRHNQTLRDTAPDFPVYSLLAENIGHDLSYAMCYNDLCSSLGITSRIVKGTRNGNLYYWNLLILGQEVFHVDLRRYVEQGIRTMTPLYDETLLAEGYEWDQLAYPAAPDPTIENEENTESSSGEEESIPDSTTDSTENSPTESVTEDQPTEETPTETPSEDSTREDPTETETTSPTEPSPTEATSDPAESTEPVSDPEAPTE